MGRRLKYTFLQRKYTDGQKAHGKMLNSLIITETLIKIAMWLSPHTSQKSHHAKSLQIINSEEGVEKRGPSCPVGGNISRCSNHYREQYVASLKN